MACQCITKCWYHTVRPYSAIVHQQDFYPTMAQVSIGKNERIKDKWIMQFWQFGREQLTHCNREIRQSLSIWVLFYLVSYAKFHNFSPDILIRLDHCAVRRASLPFRADKNCSKHLKCQRYRNGHVSWLKVIKSQRTPTTLYHLRQTIQSKCRLIDGTCNDDI